jgi:hypothetical protein
MMNENERETPMTDAQYAKTAHETTGIALIGMTTHARKLERMCAELAEALCKHESITNMCGCDKCSSVKRALAKYTAMKEGKV